MNGPGTGISTGDDTTVRPQRRVLRLARALGIAAFGLLGAVTLTPLATAVSQGLVTPDPPQPADAIVALAATIHEDGTLSEDSLRRLVRAIELYTEGWAPLLILSGGPLKRGLDEAAVRSALARRLGVPAPAIVPLAGPHTTHEEGQAVAAVLGPRAARRVLIVTDWAHARRARATFRHAGLDARVAVTGRPADPATPEGRLRLAWECARELLAQTYYRLAGLA